MEQKLVRMNIVAFMAHIPTSQLTKVHEVIKQYATGKYLITAESKPYEHMHYYVEMPEQRYLNYRDNVFRKQYKLSGRATAEKPRQYGKIKILNDRERYLSYIMKEKGPYVTNMTQEELDAIPEWTQKIIPGYKFKDYIQKQDNETFVELLKKEYLAIVKDAKYGIEEVHITVEDIAKLWLKNYDKMLPRYDSLMFMCYKAGLMSQHELISSKYGLNWQNTIFSYY